MNGAAAHQHLLDALSRARWRLVRLAALEALALATAGTAVVGLLASLIATLVDEPPVVLRLVLLVLLVGCWATALLGRFGRLLVRQLDDRTLARRLGRLEPSLDSDPLSALELYPRLAEETAQPARNLAAALVDWVGERARQLDLGRLLPARRARRLGLAAAGSALLYLLVAVAVPASASAVWAGVFRPFAPAPAAAPEDLAALLGDFVLTYRYPAHTGLETRTVEGGSGDVLAPAGTRVHLRARSARPLARGEVRLPGGMTQALAVDGEGGELTTEFVALAPGQYVLAAHDRGGRALVESRGHRLDLVPDRAPEIELLEPLQDIEVKDTAQVTLRYRARDDYGVSRVALVYRRESLDGPGVEQRQELATYERSPREVSGARPFDLAALDLRPGDRVRYYLEARDQDALAGPKAGVTPTREIRIYSPRDRHGELIAAQERVWEQAISLLGDVLEEGLDLAAVTSLPDPGAPVRLRERLLVLAGQVRALRSQLDEDPLRDEIALRVWREFDQALRGLTRTVQRRFRGRDGAAVPVSAYRGVLRQVDRTLEEKILALADQLDRQRYDQALSSAEGLAAAKERLRELMARLAAENDPEIRRQILEEIARLKRRLAAVMAEMARTARGIPDEFLNPDALESRDMMSMLGKMEEALAAGDLQGAMDMLDDFSRQLDATLADLEAGQASLADAKFGEIFDKINRTADEIAELEGLERELGQRLDDLLDEYRKQAGAEMGQRGQRALEELGAKARALAEDLARLAAEAGDTAAVPLASARERAALLEAQIQVGELGEAEQTARQTAEDSASAEGELFRALMAARTGQPDAADGVRSEALAREARQAAELATEIAEELAELRPPSAATLFSRRQRQRVEELGTRQGEAGQQCRGVGDRLSQLLGEVPGLGHEPAAQLRQAEHAMRSAKQDLGEYGLGPSRNAMERAIDRLARARSSLQQAMENMRRGASGGGGRVGGQSRRGERVAIPAPEDYRVPKEFREDLLEAMKRPVPEEYEDQIKKYYEELVR